jgi:hypothetical protein
MVKKIKENPKTSVVAVVIAIIVAIGKVLIENGYI